MNVLLSATSPSMQIIGPNPGPDRLAVMFVSSEDESELSNSTPKDSREYFCRGAFL